MSLAVLKISKDVVNGVEITPNVDVTSGLVRWATFVIVMFPPNSACIGNTGFGSLLAIPSRLGTGLLLDLQESRPCCVVSLVTLFPTADRQ